MYLDRVLSSPLPGEKIVFYLRRHPLIFFKTFIFYGFMVTWPVAAYFLSLKYWPTLTDLLLNGVLLEILTKLAVSFYYLVIWIFFWNAWVDYYMDVWLVTTDRLIGYEQKGLFNRTVAELRLSRVQDVNSKVKGFWGTIFHFGDVVVQTAGEAVNFELKNINQPYQVAEKILRQADDWRYHHHNEV